MNKAPLSPPPPPPAKQPVAPAAAPVVPEEEGVQSKSAPLILLVEDDEILQELYTDRFTAAGFRVVQAMDGMAALDQMAANADIRLVLLDIMLPRLSGYDVLAQIKRHPEWRHIPVIIVSALADIDDQARGLQLGAADYITKGEMLPGAVIEKIQRYVLSVPGPAAGGAGTPAQSPAPAGTPPAPAA